MHGFAFCVNISSPIFLPIPSKHYILVCNKKPQDLDYEKSHSVANQRLMKKETDWEIDFQI